VSCTKICTKEEPRPSADRFNYLGAGGFANFGSIAIQIGGYGSLVPERRKDFAWLGLRAMIGGSLAAFMTATIAGVLI
jgi:nucleoside permease NupC